MNYRFYLIDHDGHIISAEWLAVETDAKALEAACLLYDACSEMCAGVEVWRGAVLVAKESIPATHNDADTACSLALQHAVFDLIQRMRRSTPGLQVSSRVLDELQKLASLRGTGTGV